MRTMSKPETPGEGEAHDILAAEAFGFPAADPDLHHHGPVELPEDPTGIEEPHDVLAAEEFPMPAVSPAAAPDRLSPGQRPWTLLAAGLLGALVLARLLRRR
jgi:hypothetical protein